MKKQLLSFGLAIAMAMVVSTAFGQLRTPAPSPGATLNATVGLTDVTVEYSRPSAKGRTIFSTGADALLPYGAIWRTGANAATKVTFSKDVEMAGKTVKAGSYAILTKPGAKEWEVMMFPYESGSWNTYVEKDPALQFTVEPKSTGDFFVETFTFDVGSITNNSANLTLMWENTMVAIPFTVHTGKEVMAAFEKMMAGPSPAEYYGMGSYLLSEGKDLESALKYIQKATHGENPRYWQLRTEALALAKLKKYDEAVKVAKKSLELAKENKNNDYVRMNEASIAEWSKM